MVRGWNPGGVEIFCACAGQPWDPLSLPYNGYWVSFLGIKWQGCDIDHPPHLVPKLKKE